jgi:hypothetical protein
LSASTASRAVISLARFNVTLGVDGTTLSNKMERHVHALPPLGKEEKIQGYLRDAVRVIKAAFATTGNVETTLIWFAKYPLQPLDNKMPIDLVLEGRADELVQYLLLIEPRFLG